MPGILVCHVDSESRCLAAACRYRQPHVLGACRATPRNSSFFCLFVSLRLMERTRNGARRLARAKRQIMLPRLFPVKDNRGKCRKLDHKPYVLRLARRVDVFIFLDVYEIANSKSVETELLLDLFLRHGWWHTWLGMDKHSDGMRYKGMNVAFTLTSHTQPHDTGTPRPSFSRR